MLAWFLPLFLVLLMIGVPVFFAMLAGSYVGQRNNIGGQALQGFFTIDAQIQRRFVVKTPAVEEPAVVSGIKIGNLLDAAYQNIENYPMPGRYAEVFIRVEIR